MNSIPYLTPHSVSLVRALATSLVCLLAMTLPIFAEQESVKEQHVSGYQTRTVEGWTVHLSDGLMSTQKDLTESALKLLEQQLHEIIRVVPAKAVVKLREVPLWFSPEYPGTRARAEYHPGAEWLRQNKRNPQMAKGVEFTNVKDFAAEMKRMPNFALHELAHGFHDRVLGNNQAEVIAAYERAKASGTYDNVERGFGDGRPNTHEKAYAMTNHMEYFAESSESFFARNDFFPFNRAELHQHDPQMEQLLERLWKAE